MTVTSIFISPQLKTGQPQTTDTNVCQEKVRVGTGQYFYLAEGFAT